MRIILLAIVVGYIAGTQFYAPQLLPVSEQEIKYLIFSLCGYLVVEGFLQLINRSQVAKSYSTDIPSQENHHTLNKFKEDLDFIKASILTLEKKLKKPDSEKSEKIISENLVAEKLPIKSEEIGNNIIENYDKLISFLSILQVKGRFIDFCMQDISKYDDKRVLSVAKFVHDGCKRALIEHINILPLFDGKEGDQITVYKNYSLREYKLSGSVPESPPFNGKVVHKGWKSNGIKLPTKIESDNFTSESDRLQRLIIAPTEIEVI
jgi:hypothetical protein